MFKVRRQVQEKPVIEIMNSTPADLRLTLQDIHGLTESYWIPFGTTKTLTIPEGDYRAVIEAPYDALIDPTDGSVEVLNYHHYEADFVVTRYVGVPWSFYIGD